MLCSPSRSYACNTCCYTGHSFSYYLIILICDDHTYWQAFSSENVTTGLNDVRLSQPKFNMIIIKIKNNDAKVHLYTHLGVISGDIA